MAIVKEPLLREKINSFQYKTVYCKHYIHYIQIYYTVNSSKLLLSKVYSQSPQDSD